MKPGEFIIHREIDSPTADPAGFDWIHKRSLFNCLGWESMVAKVEFEGGTNPSCILNPLIYDALNDTFLIQADTPALYHLDGFEFASFQSRIFIKVISVNGDPAKLTLKILPGKRHL